jgi:uncharacterized membrane protein
MRGEYSSVDERADEISRLLEDEVLLAILAYIVDTGGCTREDLKNLDTVSQGSEAVLMMNHFKRKK